MVELRQAESQINKFKQAARTLECDESEEAFLRNLRTIAKAHVEKTPAKR